MKRVVVILLSAVLVGACSSSEQSKDQVACPAADTADVTAITPERAQLLVGMLETDAETCAADLGWAYRVGSRDGASFAVTADYSQQRVTVTVTLGVVTAISVG